VTDGDASGRPVRTLFLGSGTFAVPILRALAEAPEVALVAVITAPPRPAGRTGDLRPTPVAEAASLLGLPVLTPGRLREPVTQEAIAALAPGLIVLADYGRIVPGALLDLPAHGALNLHPSLLPRHRGATPLPAAILAGDTETGVTLMRMDEGVDTGPIVAVRRLALRGDERAPALEATLAALAAELLRASLGPWLAGSLPARPQPAAGASLTRPLRKEDARLDPGLGAERLARVVRAYDPWPGAWLELPSGRLIVHEATAVPGAPTPEAPPGTLVAHADGVALVTSAGLLVLGSVQPAGKRRMSGAEWRRGLRELLAAPGAGSADRG